MGVAFYRDCPFHFSPTYGYCFTNGERETGSGHLCVTVSNWDFPIEYGFRSGAFLKIQSIIDKFRPEKY